MQTKLLDLLACPKCRSTLACEAAEHDAFGDVETGTLRCTGEGHTFPIVRGIPRFVPSENYAASFGYQWNLFKKEQLDSLTGRTQSSRRFWSETGWSSEEIRGKWILDCGCGAGRFLDIATQADCDVVGVDISNAVDAAKASLSGRRNLHLVQASIYELPFRPGVFDGAYCIGVIQHTPDPERTVRAIPPVVKAGGSLAVTIYERRPLTLLNAKYLIRPVTKRLNHKALLAGIRGVMPVLFPATEVLFRLPVAGRAFQAAIPVANYVNDPELSMRERYQWAVLDTFDMLSPAYDQPQREADVVKILQEEGVTGVKRLPNSGLNLVGTKAAAAR